MRILPATNHESWPSPLSLTYMPLRTGNPRLARMIYEQHITTARKLYQDARVDPAQQLSAWCAISCARAYAINFPLHFGCDIREVSLP